MDPIVHVSNVMSSFEVRLKQGTDWKYSKKSYGFGKLNGPPKVSCNALDGPDTSVWKIFEKLDNIVHLVKRDIEDALRGPASTNQIGHTNQTSEPIEEIIPMSD